MKEKMIFVGRLTKDAVLLHKDDAARTEYYMLKLTPSDKDTGDSIYYTAFVFNISTARAKLLTKGSRVHLIGDYSDSLNCPKELSSELKEQLSSAETPEEVMKIAYNAMSIDRIINPKYIDILYHHKSQK